MADADFITILSDDMLSSIVEQYFNTVLYKQKVEVVDLKPTETGYMFSVALVNQSGIVEEKDQQLDIVLPEERGGYSNNISLYNSNGEKVSKTHRNKKGQFSKSIT